ncbi:FkbM family methyltransferase [Cyanobium sp. FGCU-6]|nr:FkbM family methyltransferase [Cyanobium sp. FGCU6]
MKSILDKVLWKVGFYGQIPSPPVRVGIDGPYASLHDAPRYQPAVLRLDDHEFEVADGFSFYWMHKEIYIDEVYRFLPCHPRPYIIDCGANYGVSVLWFKRMYPDCRILAVEADPGIYDMLRRNVNRHGLSDVTLIHRAVSGALGDVRFQCIGADQVESMWIESLAMVLEFLSSMFLLCFSTSSSAMKKLIFRRLILKAQSLMRSAHHINWDRTGRCLSSIIRLFISLSNCTLCYPFLSERDSATT